MSDHPEATSDHDAPTAAATAPVTVEQAAAVLGVSVTTVKRRIRAGSLRAEQAQRPQGTVWLVYLDPAATPAAEERPPAASVAATAPTSTPAAEAMVSLIQTTIGTVLGPLVAELAASRRTIERQADQLVSQAETIGQLRAERDAAEARCASILAAQTVEPTAEPLTPFWRRFWPLLIAVAAILLAAGALLIR